MSVTLTTAQLADEFGTTPRNLRKFLRATLGDGKGVVGKGSRYEIERKQVKSLAKAYAAWKSAQDAKKVEADIADETPETVEETE